MAEYRITYAIEQRSSGGSGPCADIEDANNTVSTVIETYRWDTAPDMPDPEDIRREMEDTHDA